MATKILKVTGMHCASCASIITKRLTALPHVNSVSVNYGNEKAKIDFNDDSISVNEMNQEIEKLGYSLSTSDNLDAGHDHMKMEGDELEELKNKIDFILPVTFILKISFHLVCLKS